MINQTWLSRCLQLGLAGSLVGVVGVRVGDRARAQITPDNTLGAESSVVTPEPGYPVDVIQGGARRGANLFHSFQEFNVGEGRGAYFTNPTGIQKILSRVTGNNVSHILGTLGVLGNANLFLINPNGIIFGPSSSLDVGGSFVATTANAVRLGDTGIFSASEPATSNLLTVNPSALFFNTLASQAEVVNRSTATSTFLGFSLNGFPERPINGLQVLDGQSLLLVGGSVNLNGGILQAPGGRVELGGVSGSGTVGLNVDGNNLRLSYPAEVQRADVSLTNGAIVDVSAGGGGSIALNARNLDVLGGSSLFAGIGSSLGSVGSQAGDITLNATDAITVGQSSRIQNAIGPDATGTGGNVSITTESLSVTDGAQLDSTTYGRGDAGSVTINAGDNVSFDGTARDGYPSGAFSNVEEKAMGRGGNIDITTGSLLVNNGSQLNTGTQGQGDAGNIIIRAGDRVSFDGTSTNGQFVSDALSSVGPRGVGRGGNIDITTGSLSVTGGAALAAEAVGKGNAGSIIIRARDRVSFDGTSDNGVFPSGVFSQVVPGGVGRGGNIDITTGSLLVSNGAQLLASTLGRGDAGSVIIQARDRISLDGATVFASVEGSVGRGGNIDIRTGSLSVTNGAQLQADTSGQGDAGSVTINARDTVSFDGGSAAFSSVYEGAVGNGGDINITTGSLAATNGAYLNASTSGKGDAGSVNINARDTVSFDGRSAAFSNVNLGAAGNGGGINVTTGSLFLTNGAELLAFTAGEGDAGSVNIHAGSTVSFDGISSSDGLRVRSGVFSSVDPGTVGNGSGINITTGSLSLTDGAVLTASNEGNGAAGNIEVVADSIRLDNQGELTAETASGQGGNITLRSHDLLLLRHNSQISSTAGNAGAGGNGGNIKIDSPFIVAVPSENSDITANANQGAGGVIQITAQGVFGIERRSVLTPLSDITAFSQQNPELNGVVEINTPDVDPSQGLVALPAQLVDASGLIASGCGASRRQGESKFIVTGRGGLPIRPGDADLSPYPTGTVRSIPSSNPSSDSPRSSVLGNDSATNPTTESAPTQIVEATRWVINGKGEVVLIAQAPTITPHNPWMNPATCHTP